MNCIYMLQQLPEYANFVLPPCKWTGPCDERPSIKMTDTMMRLPLLLRRSLTSTLLGIYCALPEPRIVDHQQLPSSRRSLWEPLALLGTGNLNALHHPPAPPSPAPPPGRAPFHTVRKVRYCTVLVEYEYCTVLVLVLVQYSYTFKNPEYPNP